MMVRGLDRRLQVETSEVQLVVLDPGIVASLSPKDLANFKAVFSAVARQDGKRVSRHILSLLVRRSQNRGKIVVLFKIKFGS